ncbi:MAG TPA: hypothetical protein PKW14_03605 [Bacteroidota bacterium]|jgi:hypothetical protein|nr:hypothetical protein [Bacteroidota bacterium]
MSKKITFEELREMGKSKVSIESIQLAEKLKQKADAEKAKATIISYIKQSGVDDKKKQALLNALSNMLSKDK